MTVNRVPRMSPRLFDGDGDEIAGPDDVAQGMPVNGSQKHTDSLEPDVYTQTGVEAWMHLLGLTVKAVKGCGVCGVSWCVSCEPQYSRVRVLGKTRWVEARGTGWGWLK